MDEDDAALAAGEDVRVEEAPPPPPAEAEDPLAAERAVLRQAQDEVERERARLRQAQDEVARARQHGEVGALDAQVAAFEGRDWDKLIAEDPGRAQAEWVAYMRARDQRDRMAGELARGHAQRLQQAHAAVSRDIKDWSPELAGKLSAFGRSMGFSDEELGAITDPRQIKVLHAAWSGAERARQAQAAEQLATAQRYAPVPTVSGAAGRIETAPDTDDFLAFERLAAARGR
ncbi:hypothetical protein [Caulobacter sp. 17J80-11]|uniref:hypothetical protein n=1 Tax=Caulobacter sp. 17J80-11 TaxID=2763502 RepID=UPI001653D9D4|nr:hypothetical protein [Caulobacter sp. 17J80-11]MBC6982473.1 hypothetical protein [Caulobacter sp. 17J80-11]